MNDFWKNLAALLKVKTIVTMVVIFVFSSMALAGKFQPGYGDDGGHHGDFVLFWEPERKE